MRVKILLVCLDLSVSQTIKHKHSLLPCSLFTTEEHQKPLKEEMVVQKCTTEKDLLELEKLGTEVEEVGKEEGNLGLDGREDLMLNSG
jgi:hypothetical protein